MKASKMTTNTPTTLTEEHKALMIAAFQDYLETTADGLRAVLTALNPIMREGYRAVNIRVTNDEYSTVDVMWTKNHNSADFAEEYASVHLNDELGWETRVRDGERYDS